MTSLPKPTDPVNAWFAFYDHYVVGISIASSSLILAHHILRLFTSKLNAILDWCLTFVEICTVAYLTGFSFLMWFWGSRSIIFRFTLVTRPIQLAALLMSGIWSMATLMRSPQKIILQHFEFLGGCSQPGGHYTPARILINRGEPHGIAIVRGIILSILCVSLGPLGVYTIIFVPLNAQSFTRQVLASPVSLPVENENIGSNVGIVLCGQFGYPEQRDAFNSSYSEYLEVNVNGMSCSLNFIAPDPLRSCGPKLPNIPEESYSSSLWSCEISWQTISSIDILVRHDFMAEADRVPMIYVQLGQGDFNDISQYTDAVGLMPGAHLFGTLTWTRQQVITSGFVIGGLAATRNIVISELNTLQPDTRYSSNATWNDLTFPPPDSTLSIFQQRTDPVTFVQQYTESSALDGLATMGGFWTFVNGSFALFFGANVLYFLFGRRPLSALGIVHVFQRKALIRRWHEDFPALHTEGGRPGSDSAGIVAFLRERLVDVDGDYDDEVDLGAQNPSTPEYATVRTAELDRNDKFKQYLDAEDGNRSVHSDNTYSATNTAWKCGYRLDEIPLVCAHLDAGSETTHMSNALEDDH
ncbi:hypothetical protein K438DRAFT_1754038 [Mycena galopus ATCC 62051]|nr:hypothetical protein K438DRAFT_1754038 [Mycena galopus ATCC 62051]